ncbi:MAG: Trm112 family protein [Calditrichaeota bacterium]|nr:Trm112 family protein [Calditrichota bacterium]
MLDSRLLEILVCPKCKGELEYQPDPQDDTRGKLICQQCKLVYLVEDDIPNMIIEEAQPLEE